MNLRYMFLLLFAINGLSYAYDCDKHKIWRSSLTQYDIQEIIRIYDLLKQDPSKKAILLN